MTQTDPETIRLQTERFRRRFILALVIAVSVLFLLMVRPFIVALMVAALLAGLVYPIYDRLRLWVKSAPGGATLTVLLVLTLIVLPLLGFLGLVTAEALKVSELARAWFASQDYETAVLMQKFWDWVPFADTIRPYSDQFISKLGELASAAGGFMVQNVSRATQFTVQFILNLFVMLYALFFFLVGGRQIMARLLYLMPLSDAEESRLVAKGMSVTRATLKGTFIIGIIQGGLAGIAFAIAGIKGAAFWGTIMGVLSIIPGVGAALVWIPAVIWLLISGHTGAAIGLGAWCAIVVGTVDNLLRPRLVGSDTKMSDLTILVSTLGGLAMFGAVGIVIGPLIAGLASTVWDIYGVEFAAILRQDE